LRFPLLTLAAGGNVIAPGAFDAAVAARAITEHRPSTAFMVPTHLQRMLALADVPTSRFRLLAHAGAACPAPLKTRVHEWAGVANVWEFYGATEGQFTQCHGPDWIGRTGTLGRARRGRTLFTDEGVIWCVAPVSAKFEYWNDPEKTATAWRVLPDGSEAFSVGDLGHLDDDGYLYFDGRRSDLIISGGVNVYPAQLEEVLTGVPGVDECAVFGLDDSHWGQIVCVAYVGRVSAEDVIATARAQLAAYQVPKRAFRLAELPRNANGKLIRSDLPAMIGLT
jgi:acyl-CoA synthetase (AMP-forming)/AMP-acid ligase II